jgi:hypothetical protein
METGGRGKLAARDEGGEEDVSAVGMVNIDL